MNTKTVGQRIKLAREHARITQEELAAAVGCTPQHISAIERGIKTPRLDTFVTIAETLRVSANTILQDVVPCGESAFTNEISEIVANLPGDTQLRILKALRAFAEEES